MTESQIHFEDIVVKVEEIATILGISLNGLAEIELFAVQAYISGILGGNIEMAEKIITLAQRMAEGKNPQKELAKLQKKVANLHLPIQTAPASPVIEASSKGNPPFANRTVLARRRLPKTGGHFAKWTVGSIFKGPKSTRKK